MSDNQQQPWYLDLKPKSDPPAKKSPHPDFKSSLMLMLIGLAAVLVFSMPIIISSVNYLQQKHFVENGVPVDAVILSIRSESHAGMIRKHGSSHSSRLYYADVEYTYNGTTYKPGEYKVTNKEHVLDTITLYIDPQNPEDCRTQPSKGEYIWGNIFFIPPILLGLFLTGGGLYYMLKAKKRKDDSLH